MYVWGEEIVTRGLQIRKGGAGRGSTLTWPTPPLQQWEQKLRSLPSLQRS
eukprot:NODE_4300_length_288_cov_94.376569_g3629_i0.p4 GENE.NODE_4300_length_288_cov_94.376569_g3629_i0~~NODE_4300_length_288_cov_94.376569_g3629_i0.p4  ORF type:complete len:50 (+),score=4.64 NODE_4300_length_288_cov_94.376569_g3629_i0:87-236(+)